MHQQIHYTLQVTHSTNTQLNNETRVNRKGLNSESSCVVIAFNLPV